MQISETYSLQIIQIYSPRSVSENTTLWRHVVSKDGTKSSLDHSCNKFQRKELKINLQLGTEIINKKGEALLDYLMTDRLYYINSFQKAQKQKGDLANPLLPTKK